MYIVTFHTLKCVFLHLILFTSHSLTQGSLQLPEASSPPPPITAILGLDRSQLQSPTQHNHGPSPRSFLWGQHWGSSCRHLMVAARRGLGSQMQKQATFNLEKKTQHILLKHGLNKAWCFNCMHHPTVIIPNHFFFCKCLAQSLGDKWWMFTVFG